MNETSKTIVFVKSGIRELPLELSKPFVRISIVHPNKSFLIEKRRWVASVTLWDEQATGLRITPVMYDVADRVEVGSLSFELVTKADERDEFFKLSETYSSGTLLSKIIFNESAKRIETGFIITAPDGAQIVIVPNVMPHALAVRCEETALEFFEPEYDLEEYVIESWE